MIAAKKKRLRSEKTRTFFELNSKALTKIARDYHHEIWHLTVDLRKINMRIQESAIQCQQQIKYFRSKTLTHLISPTSPDCFRDTLYHLENFNFRVTAYRDKMMQFVNQGLRIGFDEKAMGVHSAIMNNRIVKDAHIDTELKKFDKDLDFRGTMGQRVLQSHRRYYHPDGGYNAMMMPRSESQDRGERLKLWKNNIQTQTSRANRIVLKAMDMNDRIAEKMENYLKKTTPVVRSKKMRSKVSPVKKVIEKKGSTARKT